MGRIEELQDHYDTVVVGGGQSGLVTGYHLNKRGHRFVILDAAESIGDAWRRRWDSLRLFTPARFSGLSGLALPMPRADFPTKDQVADYLHDYAEHWRLPVISHAPVDRLEHRGTHFQLSVGGRLLRADSVVVATGGSPMVPAFASELDPSMVQLHASQYRRPSQLAAGPVLVVGAGNSGAEIALDLAASHPVVLAGRDTGRIPLITAGWYWWLIHKRLTVDTRAGRAFSRVKRRGTPLVRVRPRRLTDAGVRRILQRITGVSDGVLHLADGSPIPATTVLWCTGYRLNLQWVEIPEAFDENGEPKQHRGIATQVPGLYFVGMPFQYTLTSALIGGVGRDAEYIANHLTTLTARADGCGTVAAKGM